MANSEGSQIALPSGYRLEGYRIEAILGHGGFGITYRALDEDLRQVVALKEYLPREVAFRDRDSKVIPLSESERDTFEWGLERFLDEARTLARFRHPNIVGVRRFVRANDTAYLIMDYCEGDSLENLLAREGTLPPDRLEAMLTPLLDALEMLHKVGVTHRDVKPGNIYLREDGTPVLLDFGAARQALAQHSRSVTAMATPGYAAFEQYGTRGTQGPWTDIYGLAATLYRCVTGRRPPGAPDRVLSDDLEPASIAARGRFSEAFLQQIDAGLTVRPDERPQKVSEWFGTSTGLRSGELAKKREAAPPVTTGREENVAVVTSWEELREPSRIGTGLLLVSLLALILLGGWFVSQVPQSPSEPRGQRPVQSTQDSEVTRLREQATRGDATAQFNLGVQLARGDGVERDDVAAVDWYRRAAEQGYAAAQNNLGYMYSLGRGVPNDDGFAVLWFRRAARQGNASAMNNLGRMFESGRGVEEDVETALTWYERADAEGHEDATDRAAVLRARLETELADSSLSHSGDPIFGSVVFGPELGSDPHWVPILSGGKTDVSNLGLGPECIGFAASSPDFRLDWRGPTATLSFSFKAESPGEDTVLLVQGPNGQWHCNDDAHPDTLDPEVKITGARGGPYYIWVASFREGAYIEGQLGIAHRR